MAVTRATATPTAGCVVKADENGHIDIGWLPDGGVIDANSLVGNNTESAAIPSALTATQVKSLLGIVQADISDLTTASSPTFAGITLTAMSGVVKADAGVLSGSATCDDIADGSVYKRSHNDFTDTYKGYLNQSVQSGASPTFAGLTIGSISGFVKATSGALSAGSIADGDLPATIKGLTLAALETGFSISGGTTSKTITVDSSVSMSALAPIASPTFTGTVTLPTCIASSFKPSSNSTTAIQINKADGSTNVVNVDTTNGYVGIGTTTPNKRLSVIGNILAGNTGNSGPAISASTNYINIRNTTNGDSVGYHMEVVDGSTNSYGWLKLKDTEKVLEIGTTYNSGAVDITFVTAATSERMRIASGGNIGIGTASPAISSGTGLDMAGSTMRLRTTRTPSSASDTGNAGERCWDADYEYRCVATNTWQRWSRSTW